jgi:regulator of replication initiation timing
MRYLAYGLAFAVMVLRSGIETASAQSYACTFDHSSPSVVCAKQGETSPSIRLALDGVKSDLIKLLFTPQLASNEPIVIDGDPERFRLELEGFRDALDNIVLPRAEQMRKKKAITLDAYDQLISVYQEGISRYKLYIRAKVSNTKSYFCKFDEIPPSVICVAENSAERVFVYPIRVSSEFLDFVLTKNIQLGTTVEPTRFKDELENFRTQLDDMRRKAEEVRLSATGNIKLYRQIIVTYSLGQSIYKDGFSIYKRRQDI